MAEYLSEEEQLAQLKGWWWKYGWWIVLAVAIGLGGYFFLQYLNDKEAAVNAEASEVFERYQETVTNDAVVDEALVSPLLARLDGEFAGTAYQVMSLLTRGQKATEAGDIDAAIGFYQTAADGKAVAHITDVARLRLARSQQQQGNSAAAFAALQSVEGEGYRSLVAELKGDILRAQGKSEEAREAYAAAVEAQGENPRTLLEMKLADLSAPAGTAVVEDVVVDLTADSVGNDAVSEESDSQVDEDAELKTVGLETIQTELIDSAVDGVVDSAVDGAVVETFTDTALDTALDTAQDKIMTESDVN